MNKAFIDTNIFIYAAGAESPHKAPSLKLLKRIAGEELEACSDTEVLQEILYRHWHLKDYEKGIRICEEASIIIPQILSITREDLKSAMDLLRQTDFKIQPRDAIHAAVMLNHGVKLILSYDHHFDLVMGIKRIEPDI
jgi:predicted nucleic acid-binding protein